ncbi:hypothetical protein, partial [uncultured Endozoicomonas sp.]|uniref:hypothetical protein n=1 Tax=uncultured Endozoicomonas sp. TaxID=432652 RepID=UPI002606AE57
NYTLPPAVTPDANYTLPPAVTPDANSTQSEIVPAVPLPCPWWLLPVGIGTGVVITSIAASCVYICRSRSRAKEEAPIESKSYQPCTTSLSIEMEAPRSRASSFGPVQAYQAGKEVDSSKSSPLSANVPLLEPVQVGATEEQIQTLKNEFITLKEQLEKADKLTAQNSPLDDKLQQNILDFAKKAHLELAPLHPAPKWRESVDSILTRLESPSLQQGTFIKEMTNLIEKCLEFTGHGDGKYSHQQLAMTRAKLSEIAEQFINDIDQNQNSPVLEDESLSLLNLSCLSQGESISSSSTTSLTSISSYRISTGNSQSSSPLLDDRQEPTQMQNDIDNLRKRLESLRSDGSLALTPGNESAHQKRETNKILLCQAIKDLQEQQEQDLPAPEHLDTIAEELKSTQPEKPILTTLDNLLDSLESFNTQNPQTTMISAINDVLNKVRALMDNLSNQANLELETDLSSQQVKYASQGGEKGQHIQSYIADLIPIATQLIDIENNPELSSGEIMKFVSEASQKITNLETNHLQNEQTASESALQADTKVLDTIESMTARIEALVQRAELLRQEISPESQPLEVPEELIAFRERLGRVPRLVNLFEEHVKKGVAKLDPTIRKTILGGSTMSLYNSMKYDDDPSTSGKEAIQVKSEYS